MNNFDLYKKRLTYKGANYKERVDNIISKDLNNLIKTGVNTEKIKVKNQEYDVMLISKEEDIMKIAAPKELELKLGDFIYRLKDSKYWLIYKKNNIDAYFSGEVIKANYKINWRVGQDIYETYAALDKISLNYKNSIEKHFVFENLSGKIKIIIPNNTQTQTLFYNQKLIIGNRVWEVKNIDNLSYDYILILELEEILKDTYQDNYDLNIARDNIIPQETINVNYIINGLTEIDLLSGLEQTYTINNPNLNGVWSFDNKFGTIVDSNSEYIKILFNYKNFGVTTLKYLINGVEVAKLNIRVKALL